MKGLSERQAQRCEEAVHPRCRCRCGGVAHGAKRAGVATDTPREFFENLPEADPHHLPDKEEQKQRRRQGRRAKKKAAQPSMFPE